MSGGHGGKVAAEVDAGLRVVMLGRGLHRALLLARSLQKQQRNLSNA